MFKNLTDYKRKRTLKEAIGFYQAYCVLIVLLAMITSLSTPIIANTKGAAGIVGRVVAIVLCLFLSFSIVTKKKKSGNFLYLMLVIASGFLGYFGGALLGLIPAAYLTTK
jgi:hypothetical protein